MREANADGTAASEPDGGFREVAAHLGDLLDDHMAVFELVLDEEISPAQAHRQVMIANPERAAVLQVVLRAEQPLSLPEIWTIVDQYRRGHITRQDALLDLTNVYQANAVQPPAEAQAAHTESHHPACPAE